MAVPWTTLWHQFRAFWHYYRAAKTRYDVHSPFLAAWVDAVLEDTRTFYVFDEAEAVRHHWQHTDKMIDYSVDHGAGSRAGQGKKRTVSSIVSTSAIDRQAARWLFRMVSFHQPTSMLELGTNLGISALYLQAASHKAKFITIEGNPAIAALAKQSFQKLRRSPPEIQVGTFAERLPEIVQSMSSLDFVWIDGDHQYASTIRYFELLLPVLHDRSVVIVGDIHWSDGMEQAWDELCRHPRITLSVDLYHLGVLFFRPEQQQQEHFVLIPQRFKPWRLGFF